MLLNHTSKARARARSFIVSSRSVSILADRGRVTPHFRLKERPCLLAIFQNFPDHRIHLSNFPDHRIRILQALVDSILWNVSRRVRSSRRASPFDLSAARLSCFCRRSIRTPRLLLWSDPLMRFGVHATHRSHDTTSHTDLY